MVAAEVGVEAHLQERGAGVEATVAAKAGATQKDEDEIMADHPKVEMLAMVPENVDIQIQEAFLQETGNSNLREEAMTKINTTPRNCHKREEGHHAHQEVHPHPKNTQNLTKENVTNEEVSTNREAQSLIEFQNQLKITKVLMMQRQMLQLTLCYQARRTITYLTRMKSNVCDNKFQQQEY